MTTKKIDQKTQIQFHYITQKLKKRRKKKCKIAQILHPGLVPSLCNFPVKVTVLETKQSTLWVQGSLLNQLAIFYLWIKDLYVFACKISAHRYVKSIAVWDLVVDDGLDIDCLQLELYGDINEP